MRNLVLGALVLSGVAMAEKPVPVVPLVTPDAGCALLMAIAGEAGVEMRALDRKLLRTVEGLQTRLGKAEFDPKAALMPVVASSFPKMASRENREGADRILLQDHGSLGDASQRLAQLREHLLSRLNLLRADGTGLWRIGKDKLPGLLEEAVRQLANAGREKREAAPKGYTETEDLSPGGKTVALLGGFAATGGAVAALIYGMVSAAHGEPVARSSPHPFAQLLGMGIIFGTVAVGAVVYGALDWLFGSRPALAVAPGYDLPDRVAQMRASLNAPSSFLYSGFALGDGRQCDYFFVDGELAIYVWKP